MVLKQIPKLPRGIIEFSATGEVTANDYATVLLPAAFAFGFALPGELKVFPNRQLAAAMRWLGS